MVLLVVVAWKVLEVPLDRPSLETILPLGITLAGVIVLFCAEKLSVGGNKHWAGLLRFTQTAIEQQDVPM